VIGRQIPMLPCQRSLASGDMFVWALHCPRNGAIAYRHSGKALRKLPVCGRQPLIFAAAMTPASGMTIAPSQFHAFTPGRDADSAWPCTLSAATRSNCSIRLTISLHRERRLPSVRACLRHPVVAGKIARPQARATCSTRPSPSPDLLGDYRDRVRPCGSRDVAVLPAFPRRAAQPRWSTEPTMTRRWRRRAFENATCTRCIGCCALDPRSVPAETKKDQQGRWMIVA